MSDGKLSQEEIDALLGGQKKDQDAEPQEQSTPADDTSAASGPETAEGKNAAGDGSKEMSDIEGDVLGEIGNISFGSAATALSTCLNQKVEITTPKVTIVHKNNLGDEFPVPYVSIRVNYTEGFLGSCLLVIKITDASIIASLMMGGDGKNPKKDISEMEMSAVQEAMNQMMGSSSTAMSTIFSRRIDISPPEVTVMDVRAKKGVDYLPDDEAMFETSFHLKIGDLVDSNIMMLVPIEFGRTLVHILLENQSNDQDREAAVSAEPAVAVQPPAEPAMQEKKIREHAREVAHDDNQLSAASAEEYRQPENHSGSVSAAHSENQRAAANVHPLEFSSFDENESSSSATGTPRNLDLLMDIPLDVSVELGHTSKTVRDVLELGPGSIIELDKLAGEAIDILINHKYIAKGEVVVVDENFGIRITEILDHYDRLKNLK